MYLRQVMCNKGLKHKELTNLLKMDKSLVSKIINYKVLPTPNDAQKICELLQCNILDIYELEEINLRNSSYNKSDSENDRKYYRLSVRLKLGGCNLLKHPKKLKELGYESIADWARKKIKETEEEYKNLKKEKKQKKEISSISLRL